MNEVEELEKTSRELKEDIDKMRELLCVKENHWIALQFIIRELRGK